MRTASALRVFGMILVSAVAACGGGGGGAGAPSPTVPTPTPTPTPPPTGPNTDPVVSYSISGDTFDEGDTFIIDASASSDPDGSIHAIAVVHDFNPFFPELEAVQVNVGNHPEGVFEFLVPDVFGDTQVKFDISVEDDRGAVSSESAYLNFRSTVNSPRIDGFGEPYRVLDTGRPLELIGGNIESIYAIDRDAPTSSGGREIVVATDVGNLVISNNLQSNSSVLGEVLTADMFIPYALMFNLQPVTPTQFAVVSEAGNAVHWFADYDITTYPDEYELKQTIDIEKPCYFQWRVSTAQDFIWIGQRGGGLSVVQVDRYIPPDLPPGTPNSHWSRGFEYSIKSHAGGTRSLCHVYPVVLADRISNRFPQSALSDLIAIDYDSNELVLFADDAGNDEIYEIVDVLPLRTDGVQGLKIVDVISAGTPSLFPNYIVVLMSDGLHNGQHQVVVVYPEHGSNEIMQSVYTWQGGAPVQMISPGSLFGPEGRLIDYGADLVILTSTSDNAVILEDARVEVEVDLGPPIYKAPQYLDIGPGAGSLISMDAHVLGRYSRPGILISFPDSNELKLWVYRD